jgi:hypothetical protein
MKGPDKVTSMLKMVCRFPGVITGAIPLPPDKVLKFSVVPAGVKDGFHLIFFLVLNLQWRRRRPLPTRKSVRSIGFQE